MFSNTSWETRGKSEALSPFYITTRTALLFAAARTEHGWKTLPQCHIVRAGPGLHAVVSLHYKALFVKRQTGRILPNFPTGGKKRKKPVAQGPLSGPAALASGHTVRLQEGWRAERRGWLRDSGAVSGGVATVNVVVTVGPCVDEWFILHRARNRAAACWTRTCEKPTVKTALTVATR